MSATYPDPDVAVEDMRVKDARVAFGRAVGIRQSPTSALSKRALNSAYWALTGSPHYERRWHGTPQSSDLSTLRLAVARECDDEVALQGYVDTTEGERPFRRRELRALVRAIRKADDKRPAFRQNR